LPQSDTLIGNESLRDYSWFHNVEREDAEALLMTQDQDGAYLVRESKRAGKSNPFTLTIFHNGRVFHLNIRKRPDGLYALGKEKPREKVYISTHSLSLITMSITTITMYYFHSNTNTLIQTAPKLFILFYVRLELGKIFCPIIYLFIYLFICVFF
jgi:hypothetical protein